MKTFRLTSFASVLCLAACSQNEQPPVHVTAYKPVATVQDIMQSIVDPAADSLWESVETTVIAKGTEEKQPRTDEEWKTVRHHAITLVESANVLVIPGRHVVHTSKSLEDAHVAGINKAEDIQKLIDDNPEAFESYAVALRAAGEQALAAIDARDVPALVNAGGTIDAACEQCHLHYWYPNTFRPN
ncbi:MAG TPA: hypothetical protein VHL14_00825 [Steroidobacteraceae bacterium]|nr:hypothetical protein [Steroidobacteraceae bacterium]